MVSPVGPRRGRPSLGCAGGEAARSIYAEVAHTVVPDIQLGTFLGFYMRHRVAATALSSKHRASAEQGVGSADGLPTNPAPRARLCGGLLE